jgi:glutathione S-transferase
MAIITHAELLSAAVTILAILFFVWTFLRVGQMRSKHDVKAPTMTGPLEFESAVRVQMNTLEQMIIFLPLLWLATRYFHLLAWLPAAFGLLWVIGRVIYMSGYMTAPERRSTGFLVTTVASLALLVLSIWGIVNAWIVISAT